MSMLSIKNLHVHYNGSEKLSIQDVSFDVQKGDRIAILGPSGCGKSTTLNVIAGLLTEKEAKIEGVLDWRSNEKKPTIRMVFQEATLLPWRTVEKNVTFGLEIKKMSKEDMKKKVQEMLRVVGLLEYAKSYPHQLSVGMQQRVNFARALVCEPDLLLLDEPFSALDVETKKKLQEEFLRILKEKEITSIFVTHNIQEAVFMAKDILVYSGDGAILEKLKNSDLMHKNKVSIDDDMYDYE